MQTPTPATAERLARALDGLLKAIDRVAYRDAAQMRLDERHPRVENAITALAAYTAEGGKL